MVKSIEYYMMVNLPMMALATFLMHQGYLGEKQELLAEICFKYVDKLLLSVLKTRKL